jgi:hypothetical protein
MKRILLVAAVLLILPSLCLKPLWAGEMDILLKKLVEKKILTSEEAKSILEETKKELQKEMEVKKEVKEVKLPRFVQTINVKGDVRLRYQGERKTEEAARHRGRIRLRIGVESQVTDNIKAGFRLVSGSPDPRSTDQTMENFFEHPDIRFDQAYIEFAPRKEWTLVGGMFANPIWEPGEFLWDVDIMPQGAATKFECKPFFASTGFFMLNEDKGHTSSPFMVFIQPGVKFDFEKKADLKFAVAGYWLNSIKGSKPDYSSNTNSRDENGLLLYEFNSIVTTAEVGLNQFVVPRVAVFGEYVHNPDPDKENDGWMAGLKFGDPKVECWGKWEAIYDYLHLEKDAWLDTFPNSNVVNGSTGFKSHHGRFTFGLAKYTSFVLNYYYSKQIEGDIDQHIFQSEILVKF